MSGVKHTPWEEVETESSVDLEGCSGWQDIADQSGRTVAIAIGWGGWRDADLDRRARLIVAAPDFFDHAKSLVEAWDARTTGAQQIITGKSDRELQKQAMEAIDGLRAAIARARGEQSPIQSEKEVGNG